MIITVDLDTHNHFALLKAYYNLSYVSEGEVIVHHTKKGYHLTGFRDGLSINAVLKIRNLCGDDIERLFLDWLRRNKWSFGALFQVRRGKQNEMLLANLSSDKLY